MQNHQKFKLFTGRIYKLSGYSEPFVANSLQAIETFSLAKASALGLKFSDLSVIIGSAATGASISADGRLVANGIAGEFCDSIPETIVGKFSDSAITIGEQITLIANSSGANALNGDSAITCICEIGTLIPISGTKLPFWFMGLNCLANKKNPKLILMALNFPHL